MASKLDKIIVILVRVSTTDTGYDPEYTFTKPSTTFLYYYISYGSIFKLN